MMFEEAVQESSYLVCLFLEHFQLTSTLATLWPQVRPCDPEGSSCFCRCQNPSEPIKQVLFFLLTDNYILQHYTSQEVQLQDQQRRRSGQFRKCK